MFGVRWGTIGLENPIHQSQDYIHLLPAEVLIDRVQFVPTIQAKYPKIQRTKMIGN